MKGTLFAFLAVALLAGGKTMGKTATEPINLTQDSITFKGILYYDDKDKNKRPGILVVHEWWGLGDFIKSEAKRLSDMGYAALAVDLYGNGTTVTDPKMAMKLAAEVRGTPLMRRRMLAWFDTLSRLPVVDKSRTAAIGFCFGGSGVLELIYGGADTKGGVTFHAGLISPSEPDFRNIKAKLLVMQGANDPFAPPDTVMRFQDALRKSKMDWQMILFANAVHSFTNPASGSDATKGVAFDSLATKRSWNYMKLFFDELFKP
jgi:dienelactone hydrolase